MRGLVIFSIILVVMASLSFVALSMNSGKEETKYESKIMEFSTFTSAVCEDKDFSVHCKDEVFVNCNGEISKALDVAECNGLKLDIPKATGFAVFGKDWKDPRV
ncbi:hypothetical protein J4448_00275 [Candidatus Woesearchaeota archaeon]|nr:hypothetical protein [Candidatus Woesearchaeota archaeon]